MTLQQQPRTKIRSIGDLLDKKDKKMRGLFLKVMNLHAAYQVNTKSDNELLAEIRQAIEESCDEE